VLSGSPTAAKERTQQQRLGSELGGGGDFALFSPQERSWAPRDAVEEKDVSLLVKEVQSLRARLSLYEDRHDRRGSSSVQQHQLHYTTDDFDDEDLSSSSPGRLFSTDQISNARSAGLHVRTVEVAKSDVFVPEGLRSPMMRPSRFLGKKIPPLPPVDRSPSPGSRSPTAQKKHVFTTLEPFVVSSINPSPRSDSTSGDSPLSGRSKSAMGSTSPHSFARFGSFLCRVCDVHLQKKGLT